MVVLTPAEQTSEQNVTYLELASNTSKHASNLPVGSKVAIGKDLSEHLNSRDNAQMISGHESLTNT